MVTRAHDYPKNHPYKRKDQRNQLNTSSLKPIPIDYYTKYTCKSTCICSLYYALQKLKCLSLKSCFFKSQDEYWQSGMFDERITKILDTLYLDVRNYSLDYLYDRHDFINVNLIDFNENQVKISAKEALKKLKALQKIIIVKRKIG